jgi:hypothetical protein
MKQVTFFILFFCGVMYSSCGKHTYAINANELNRMAKAAMEPNLHCFVVYNNGDTVRGESIKWKYKKATMYWFMDGKEISGDKISCYQDKHSYYEVDGAREFARVHKGKVNLYLRQTDNSRVTTTMSATGTKVTSSGGTSTSFYIGSGKVIEPTTMKTVEKWVQDYPPALAKFKEEFPRYKSIMNDYRAFVRILKIYDQKPK